MKILCGLLLIGFYGYARSQDPPRPPSCAPLAADIGNPNKENQISPDGNQIYPWEDFKKSFYLDDKFSRRQEHLVWVSKDGSFDPSSKEQINICSPFSYGSHCETVYSESKITELTNEEMVIAFIYYSKDTEGQYLPSTAISLRTTLKDEDEVEDEDEDEEHKAEDEGHKAEDKDEDYIFQLHRGEGEVFERIKETVSTVPDTKKPNNFKKTIEARFALYYISDTKGYAIFTECDGPRSWVMVSNTNPPKPEPETETDTAPKSETENARVPILESEINLEKINEIKSEVEDHLANLYKLKETHFKQLAEYERNYMPQGTHPNQGVQISPIKVVQIPTTKIYDTDLDKFTGFVKPLV